ncbi:MULTISPECIES: ABC transporter ATP-binding protein [unclassified Halorhodospira]|uniref:ABC transporter ATP-binding protein n=1 Tax=unclassified Halorhodospira TaxID=2626748 RepID=UPI001EE7941B|nr:MULTISPECIES: ABC transporter ATP-binding protein [unclassified Halorhodospira]MCG5540898.1 ABC transporter ATP-binding protein [Halorhodospira sp. M39old]MCG5546317.1 ABC transporter ATP-binding protein [Halorhodospira sp. M38]
MSLHSPIAAHTTGSTDEALLCVDGLHTHFELRQWGFLRTGTVRAVDGVAFSLDAGEAIAVVGESGCGKSSLARTLLGLHRPTAGSARFAGTEVGELNGAALKTYRAQVGYVQQDPYGALPPFMEVQRILAEPLIIHGVRPRAERWRRIEAALEEVGLSPAAEVAGKFPHQLSGGQQQRVVIARALLLRPAMIIADEPVSMLDASVRVEILNLLHRVQQEHDLALLYITHDLSTVRHYVDRAMVMYGGRIVEQAPVDALLQRPQHPYTEALLSALGDPDAANAGRPRPVPGGEAPSLIQPPTGCRYHPRCPHAMAGRCELDPPPPDFRPRPEHRAACWLRE